MDLDLLCPTVYGHFLENKPKLVDHIITLKYEPLPSCIRYVNVPTLCNVSIQVAELLATDTPTSDIHSVLTHREEVSYEIFD